MTSTKNHTWVNLHLPKDVHSRLKSWCIRNGKTMQDGLTAIVDINTRPGYELRLAQSQPIVDTSELFRQAQTAHTVQASAAKAAPPLPPPQPVPVYEPEPESPEEDPRVTGNWECDNFDPDACYESEMQRGAAPDAAKAKTWQWIKFLGVDDMDDWEPFDATDANRVMSTDTNGSSNANDSEDAETQAGEPDARSIDARSH